MNLVIILAILFIFSILFSVFLKLLELKIGLFEAKIISLFKKRTWLIPWFFEISKKYIEKENEVFEEIIYLRKIEAYNVSNKIDFIDFLENEKKIHYELEFLFKVFDKKPKLQKDARFLYYKDLTVETTEKIWKSIVLYKNIIRKYNNLIKYKNLTIFGLMFRFNKKNEI